MSVSVGTHQVKFPDQKTIENELRKKKRLEMIYSSDEKIDIKSLPDDIDEEDVETVDDSMQYYVPLLDALNTKQWVDNCGLPIADAAVSNDGFYEMKKKSAALAIMDLTHPGSPPEETRKSAEPPKRRSASRDNESERKRSKKDSAESSKRRSASRDNEPERKRSKKEKKEKKEKAQEQDDDPKWRGMPNGKGWRLRFNMSDPVFQDIDFLVNYKSRKLNPMTYLWLIGYYLKQPWKVETLEPYRKLFPLLWEEGSTEKDANIFETPNELQETGLRQMFRDIARDSISCVRRRLS